MEILVHIGLNKCASTYIQSALHGAHRRLARNGVLYPVDGKHEAHYDLSCHYGFGPDAPHVTPRDLAWVVRQAEARGCERVILSSEYFSLSKTAAIETFARDLDSFGLDASIWIFSREIIGWIRSLFNQYTKTMDNDPYFHSINEFIDHAIKNESIDIASRYQTWASVFGAERIEHYHIPTANSSDAVLRPFSDFARVDLQPSPAGNDNKSLSPGALYLTGLVRRAPCSASRNFVLGAIAVQDRAWVPVPPGYLEIDAERRARLETLVVAPFLTLPRNDLAVVATA